MNFEHAARNRLTIDRQVETCKDQCLRSGYPQNDRQRAFTDKLLVCIDTAVRLIVTMVAPEGTSKDDVEEEIQRQVYRVHRQ